MSEERCGCKEPSVAKKESCCPPKTDPEPCCPPKAESEPCCPEDNPAERPGYRLWPFVAGWEETAAGRVPRVKACLEWTDVLGRWQMRWGLGRDRYRVAPGLYALGRPNAASPVLVTANYKLTFDVVRRDTAGLDAWLLVLDTKGINVWCAAGKGTFGTAELVRRVRESRLEEVVNHRTLVVPQLGAVGVAAHEVKKACGFRVVYGPVRASDLPPFIESGMRPTPEMRRVTFTTWERTVLTPVELTAFGRKTLWAALALLVLGGIGPGVFSLGSVWTRGGAAILATLAALVTGAVVTPVLLPWIPARAFAFKGALTGLAVGALGALLYGSTLGSANALALILGLPAAASFFAMNFTGSTTFTSPSGVEKEMRRAIPLQGIALIVAGIAWIAGAF
jgi:hypothetical protein